MLAFVVSGVTVAVLQPEYLVTHTALRRPCVTSTLHRTLSQVGQLTAFSLAKRGPETGLRSLSLPKGMVCMSCL